MAADFFKGACHARVFRFAGEGGRGEEGAN